MMRPKPSPNVATPAGPARQPASADAARSEDAIAADVSDSELTPRTRRAMLELVRQIDRLRGEADDLRERLRELEALADTDPLAPVYNRRAFIRELERMAAYAERYGGEAGLIFVDLDDFKSVNDEYGHQVGDAVLTHVAATLVGNVRQSDIVGRLGGDEFAVGLARGGLKAAKRKAATLEALIRDAAVEVDGRSYTASATLGASVIKKGESAEQALSRADTRMYARKRASRKANRPKRPITR